jgi:hypothetical protein
MRFEYEDDDTQSYKEKLQINFSNSMQETMYNEQEFEKLKQEQILRFNYL